MELNINKIEREMKRLGWRPIDFARELNVSRQRVSFILNRAEWNTTVTLKTIEKIAAVFGMDPKDLIK
jgi:plasmid maintenance system antidote protein VapI